MKIATQYQLIMPIGQFKAMWKYSDATWWPNLQIMQVTHSGGKICNLCKWRHLVAKFATNASGTIWWPNLKLMQVVPFGGKICNQCKWRHLVAKFATNASGAIWWPNLVQVTESISGSVVPLAMFISQNWNFQILGFVTHCNIAPLALVANLATRWRYLH